MSRGSPSPFREEQSFRQPRVRFLLAILPAGFSVLLIWQVILRHPTGNHPLSNGNVIGWTVFLWLLYLRLITTKMVTEIKGEYLRVSLRGLWTLRKIPLADIAGAVVITYNPFKEYGGYGIRSSRRRRAYIASGDRGALLTLPKGVEVLVGSQRPQELAQSIAGVRTGD